MSKGAGRIGAVAAPWVFALFFSNNDNIVASFRSDDGSINRFNGPPVTDTEFHHYAYVRSGNTHRLLVDGNPVAEGTFTGTPGDTSGLPLTIGAFRTDSDPSGFSLYFGGVIDEVQVFDRSLSDTEIWDAFDVAGP